MTLGRDHLPGIQVGDGLGHGLVLKGGTAFAHIIGLGAGLGAGGSLPLHQGDGVGVNRLPLGIESQICRHSGRKVISLRAGLIGVPAPEDITGALRVRRLCRRLAGGDQLGFHRGAALGVEGHQVLLHRGHAIGVADEAVHLAVEGAVLAADAGHGNVKGGVLDAGLAHKLGSGVLIRQEGANGSDLLSVHHQVGTASLVGDGQLHPLVVGQLIVEHILVQLSGKAQLPLAVSGRDGLHHVLAVGSVRLQKNLLFVCVAAVLVYPQGHGAIGAQHIQAGGGIAFAPCQHQGTVFQGGAGEGQVPVIAGVVRLIGEGILGISLGAFLQGYLVIGVGVGSGGKDCHALLGLGIGPVQAVAAHAPHLHAQVRQRAHKPVEGVGLVDTGGPGVDVVLPNGVAGAQHLGGAAGNPGAAHVLRLPAVIQALGVQVVPIAARGAVAAGYHIQIAVNGIDQLEAQVEHGLGIGPAGVPDIHLGPLDIGRGEGGAFSAAHLGQAAPYPHLTALLVADVVDHFLQEGPVGRMAVVELVGADVNDGVLVIDARFDVLVENVLDDVHSLGLADVHMIEPGTVAALLFQNQVRAVQGVLDVVGNGQSVGRNIDFGNDVHTQSPGVLHEGLKLFLGVVVILGGQAVLGVLQTEALVGVPGLGFLAGSHIVLHENQVVAQVDMEAVHLVPGHVLHDVLEGLHGGGLPAHIQHEAPVLELGIVPGGTLGDGVIPAQLQDLQDGAGAPVAAHGIVGPDDHLIRNHHVIGFLVEAAVIVVGQDNVPGLGAALHDGKVQAEQVGNIRLELLGNGQEVALCHNPAVGGEAEGLALLLSRGIPLGQLRHHHRLFVAFIFRLFAGDGQLHGGRALVGHIGLLPHGNGDFHLGIHQGGVDGAVGTHYLLKVAAPLHVVLGGHFTLDDHLAVLHHGALGQFRRGQRRGHHNLGFLLIHFKLIQRHIVPEVAGVAFHPHPDIPGFHRRVKVYRLDGGGGRGELALIGFLGRPVLPIQRGLDVPLVGVVVLPVENHAAHHIFRA